MKKAKLFLIMLLTLSIAAFICACTETNSGTGSDPAPKYEISLDTERSFELEVGEEVDYTQYFIVKDQNGNRIVVSEEMLDLSQADTSVPGMFWVTLKIGDQTLKAEFTVTVKQTTPTDPDDPDKPVIPDDPSAPDYRAVFEKYADASAWNFAVNYTVSFEGDTDTEYYEYLGLNVKNTYTDEDGNEFTDYLGYDSATDVYTFYAQNMNGSYTSYSEETDEFAEYTSYLYLIDLTALSDYSFTQDGNHLVADDPAAAGNAVICEYDEGEWTSVTIDIMDGKIVKVVGVMDDGYTEEYDLIKQGSVNFTLPAATEGGGTDPVDPVDPNNPPSEDYQAVLEKYADPSTWNFAVDVSESYDGETYEEYYEYSGYDILNTYTDTYGDEYTDYVSYSVSADAYTYYQDNGDGTYSEYDDTSTQFEDYYTYSRILDLSVLADYTFTASGNKYAANDPAEVGMAVLGDYGEDWTTFDLYIANEQIVKIVAAMADGYTQQYTFSNHGSVRFTLPDGSGSSGTDTPVTPSDTMEKQDYNAATFDKGTLQEKMLNADGAIGLPSKGDIHALVIPVQFVGDTITAAQLENLRKAFNGTETDTGWESVKSYYEKSSYGNLKLTFDIQDVYQAKKSSSYYASYKSTGYYEGQSYPITGDTIILEEALNYYQSKLDLTDYDTNNDGCIDAVYLIYSAPVDYDNADFYWAYVTWYYGDTQYDGLDAYYYLFASFEFMDESTSRDSGSGYNKIDGLKINADTYIHETGHLLGLDDYYDYDERSGCNEGLGGADMMDYNVGDHGVYSKIMLGWLSPTVVNETKTVTLQPSVSNASAILIPLNFDNSYFSEYLLIDLYSATGLNELHSKQAQTSDAVLYGGASYGVRIYHVSSSVTNSYSTDYQSFTDYNNSDTKYALVKLVEADGTKKFSNSDGSAAKSDLWLAGSSLLGKFPSYTRNDGKKINFDVAIDSVTATQARITVTFQ